MHSVIIVGLGNPFRGDDAAGWIAIDELKKQATHHLHLRKTRGDVSELLEFMQEGSKLILIDACKTSDSKKSWEKIDLLHELLPYDSPASSTHALSLVQAIALAKQLNQLPKELFIFAIYGSRFDIEESISPSVYDAILSVVKEILLDEDVKLCMKAT